MDGRNERLVAIEDELKGYRSLIDGEKGEEKECQEGGDRVSCWLPPLHSMAEAAPWLLKFKKWEKPPKP